MKKASIYIAFVSLAIIGITTFPYEKEWINIELRAIISGVVFLIACSLIVIMETKPTPEG